MDVDVRDLELLEALDQHQTLTAAADHLYVSQPALSQRLLRLEQRLGAPLFERRGRRLVANPAGARMLRAARVALYELRDAVREVGDNMVDAIDQSLKHRPYTTLALAVGIGFLFGATWRR